MENKIKYLMGKKNLNIRQYEEIIFDFYPDRKRIDAFFDQYQTIYDYRLSELGKAISERLKRKGQGILP